MTGDVLAPCIEMTVLGPGALRADVDISRAPRPSAARARVSQAMAELSVTLRDRLEVHTVVAVVWTGPRSPSGREWTLVSARAEDLHRRSEMLRGEPLALAIVFADDATAATDLERAVRADSRRVPDGVCAMTWREACARGIPACAASARI